MHVTKDGKKLGTGNNFPNTKSSFSYSVSSGFLFHDLLHYQLDSSMRDQKVFCVLSGLGVLSNIKVLECSWSFFPHFPPKCLNTDFRPGCSGLCPVGCWKCPRTQVHDLSGLPVANYSHSEMLPFYIQQKPPSFEFPAVHLSKNRGLILCVTSSLVLGVKTSVQYCKMC